MQTFFSLIWAVGLTVGILSSDVLFAYEVFRYPYTPEGIAPIVEKVTDRWTRFREAYDQGALRFEPFELVKGRGARQKTDWTLLWNVKSDRRETAEKEGYAYLLAEKELLLRGNETGVRYMVEVCLDPVSFQWEEKPNGTYRRTFRNALDLNRNIYLFLDSPYEAALGDLANDPLALLAVFPTYYGARDGLRFRVDIIDENGKVLAGMMVPVLKQDPAGGVSTLHGPESAQIYHQFLAEHGFEDEIPEKPPYSTDYVMTLPLVRNWPYAYRIYLPTLYEDDLWGFWISDIKLTENDIKVLNASIEDPQANYGVVMYQRE